MVVFLLPFFHYCFGICIWKTYILIVFHYMYMYYDSKNVFQLYNKKKTRHMYIKVSSVYFTIPVISLLIFGRSAGQELLTVRVGAAIPGLWYTSNRFPGSYRTQNVLNISDKCSLIYMNLAANMWKGCLPHSCLKTQSNQFHKIKIESKLVAVVLGSRKGYYNYILKQLLTKFHLIANRHSTQT